MYDIIVIGGGPAGLTAAVYARRANKTCLVIEKGAFGGQITFSPKVENIPGFAEVTGNEFAEKVLVVYQHWMVGQHKGIKIPLLLHL